MDFWLPFYGIEPVCIACLRSQSQSKNKMNIDLFFSLRFGICQKEKHTRIATKTQIHTHARTKETH